MMERKPNRKSWSKTRCHGEYTNLGKVIKLVKVSKLKLKQRNRYLFKQLSSPQTTD